MKLNAYVIAILALAFGGAVIAGFFMTLISTEIFIGIASAVITAVVQGKIIGKTVENLEQDKQELKEEVQVLQHNAIRQEVELQSLGLNAKETK